MNGRSLNRTRVTGIRRSDNTGDNGVQTKLRVSQYVSAVESLMREVNLSPPKYDSVDRKYLTAAEAASTLGLDAEKTRKAADYITAIVKDTQDLMGITAEARLDGMPRHVISELIKRAMRMQREESISKSVEPDDNLEKAKKPSKKEHPPAGFVPAKNSKKGGYRKPSAHGGYEYWYPGEGISGEPHESEHPDMHHQHAKSTPHPDVKAAFAKVHKKAADAGMPLNGKNGRPLRPDSRHTVEAIQDLEAQVDKRIAAAGSAVAPKDQQPLSPDAEGGTIEDHDAALKELEAVVNKHPQFAALKDYVASFKKEHRPSNKATSADINLYGEQIRSLRHIFTKALLGFLTGGTIGFISGATAGSGQAESEINAIVGLHNKMVRDEKAKASDMPKAEKVKKPKKAKKPKRAKPPKAAKVEKPAASAIEDSVFHSAESAKPQKKAEKPLKKSGVYLDTRTGRIVVKSEKGRGIEEVIEDELLKAGPFIGPRGGKWADAKHTIAWNKPSYTAHDVTAAEEKVERLEASVAAEKSELRRKLTEGEIDYDSHKDASKRATRRLQRAKKQRNKIRREAHAASLTPEQSAQESKDKQQRIDDRATAVAQHQAQAKEARKQLGISRRKKTIASKKFKANVEDALKEVFGSNLGRGSKSNLSEAMYYRVGDFKIRTASHHPVYESSHNSYNILYGIPESEHRSGKYTYLPPNPTKADIKAAVVAVAAEIESANTRESLTKKALTAGHQIEAPVKDKKDAKKATAKPKKKIKKSRGRHAETGFGHRDNLRPGMSLLIRKSHRRDGWPDSVAVLDDGYFSWGEVTFPNGNQLLKSLYGRERHKMTVRRYFGLGGEESDIVVSLLGTLKTELFGKALVTRDTATIRITGSLAGLIPETFLPSPDATTLMLEAPEAKKLVDHFRSLDHG